jgi:SNF family Na+-dependent transporter
MLASSYGPALKHAFVYLQAALGPGLVFIAFSDAIRSMPAAPVWSVLFFLMCLTLGIDSLFGGLESVAASLADLKRLSKVRIEYISGTFNQGLPEGGGGGKGGNLPRVPS